MTTKAKLLERIEHIENDSYLEAILNYLEDSEKEPIVLTASDIESINKSTDQIAKGEFLSQKDLENKINGWIEK